MVGQRTQEIGVRRALGAKAADVMVMLMREAMRPVAIGIVIGIAGAYAMTRLLAAMLFEISATDVTTYVVACAVLGVAGAARVDRSRPPRARRRSDHRGARPVTATDSRFKRLTRSLDLCKR